MTKSLINWALNNKLITILGIFLLLEGFLFLLFGYRIIDAMYQGESLNFLNKMLKGRAENSLDFYIKRYNMYFICFNFILASLVLFFSFCWRSLSDRTPILQLVMKEALRLKEALSNNKKIISLSLLLSLGFYSLYISLGLGLIPFNGNFFGADQNEWLSIEWYKY